MAIASPRIGSATEILTAMRERTSTAVRDPKAPDVTGTPAPMAAASHPCMSATPSRIVRMERTSRIVKVVREMSPASPIVSRENASRRLRCAMACPTVPMVPMRKTVMRANTSAITASVSRMPMCAMERKTATAERTRNSVREQKPVERRGSGLVCWVLRPDRGHTGWVFLRHELHRSGRLLRRYLRCVSHLGDVHLGDGSTPHPVSGFSTML